MNGSPLPSTRPGGRPLPPLAALGIDISQIETEPLPNEAWRAIEAVVAVARQRSARMELAILLYQACLKHLKDGRPIEDVRGWLAEPRAIARVARDSRTRTLLADAFIPARLLASVQRVARGWGYWRRERAAIVRELCLHVAQGLARGRAVEELEQSFGPPRLARKLLLRAARQRRPLWWRAARRLLQTSAALLLALLLAVAAMHARFYTARPPPQPDVLQPIDARGRLIPPDDRAWPLYREAALALYRDEQFRDRGVWQRVGIACTFGPANSDWPMAASFLERHTPTIGLVLQGSARPALGYIYRDSENDTFHWHVSRRSTEQLYPPNVARDVLLLPQIDVLLSLALLLRGETRLAMAQGEARRAARALVAQARLHRQMAEAADFVMIELMARGGASQVLQFLNENSGLLPEDLLAMLLDELVPMLALTARPLQARFAAMFEELVASMYTDDGDGGGRMTPEGMQTLRRALASRGSSPLDWVLSWLGNEPARNTAVTHWRFRLCAPLLAAAIGGRAENLAKMRELIALCTSEDPQGPFFARAEYDRLMADARLQLKYLPVLVEAGPILDFSRLGETLPRVDAAGAVAAAALELYRRRHGDYPESPGQLLEEVLAEWPEDPCAPGAPLGYVRVHGHALVYSVGTDGVDNTASLKRFSAERPRVSRRDIPVYTGRPGATRGPTHSTMPNRSSSRGAPLAGMRVGQETVVSSHRNVTMDLGSLIVRAGRKP